MDNEFDMKKLLLIVPQLLLIGLAWGQANPSFSFNAFINPENVEIEILEKIKGLLVTP